MFIDICGAVHSTVCPDCPDSSKCRELQSRTNSNSQSSHRVILNFSAVSLHHDARFAPHLVDHSGRPTPRRRPNGGKMPSHHQHPTTTLLGQTRVRYALLESARERATVRGASPNAKTQQGRPQHFTYPERLCRNILAAPLRRPKVAVQATAKK
jgi:hypothetical protein